MEPLFLEYCMKAFRKHGFRSFKTVGHSTIFNPYMNIVTTKDYKNEHLGSEWSEMLDSRMKFGMEIADCKFIQVKT